MALREWARRELKGYAGADEVPDYRKVHGVPISMDSVSGNAWATGQIISRLNLPQEAWDYVPDEFSFRQPIEELEKLALTENLRFNSAGLSYAQMIWNKQLGAFQSIQGLAYVMAGSVVSGILGQIRTHLVDLIADLTVETPLAALPRKEIVDAAVSQYIGQIYHTNIASANGLAIGSEAQATNLGLSVKDALDFLEAARAEAVGTGETHMTELLGAIDDLRAAVQKSKPDTGEVVKKAGVLRKVADKLGVATITAATSGATTVLIEAALSGAFG